MYKVEHLVRYTNYYFFAMSFFYMEFIDPLIKPPVAILQIIGGLGVISFVVFFVCLFLRYF